LQFGLLQKPEPTEGLKEYGSEVGAFGGINVLVVVFQPSISFQWCNLTFIL